MITAQKTIGFPQTVESQKNAHRRAKLAAGGAFGSRRMSTVILPPYERWRDWLLAVLAIAIFSGVLPGLACAALIALFDAVGWWPLWASLAVGSAALLRWMWS